MFTNKKETKREKKTESTEKEKEMRLIWLETTRGANRMKKKEYGFLYACVSAIPRARVLVQSTRAPKKKRKKKSHRICSRVHS